MVKILPETTKNPIILIGQRAGICWGADTSDNTKNYQRGYDCIKANHGRTLEFVNIELVLSGYSARVIREWYTHIGGLPTRLQESTRYINESNCEMVIPTTFDETQKQVVRDCFAYTMKAYKFLLNLGASREDAAMILPLGMETKIVDKRNLRSFSDMCQQRLCSRAYLEYRKLMTDVITALENYGPEWKEVSKLLFKPKCDALGYCPEKKSCGRHKQK